MLKPRKKTTLKAKKDLKEDKFIGTVLNTKEYIEQNYRTVLTYVFAVFIIIIAIMYYSHMRSQTSLEATTLFGKAQVEYQNFNYTKAKELLGQLIDEYGGTEQGQQGMLFLANLYFQEKSYDQAKQMFYEFIDSYGGSKILLGSGYAGYASCLELESDYLKAAEYYNKARETAPEFVEASNWLYLSGKNYLKAGASEEARNAFHTIIDDYPDSDRKFDAESQLILMAQK